MRRGFMVCLSVLALWGTTSAQALDTLTFTLPNTSESLASALKAASLTEAAKADGRTDAQEIFGAAQSDYARLLGALYAAGHYSGVISIKIDGREAADILPLNAPRTIRNVEIRVDPGPAFTFSRAEIGPLARRTVLPTGYRAGEPALSGTVRSAAQAALNRWREEGHAKAEIAQQSLKVDHTTARMDARLQVAQGPAVVFGTLTFTGQERMRLARLYKIAGLEEGTRYSPEELRRATDRLRRTGVFRSVALIEAEKLRAGNRLDITAQVAEMPLRRLGFGAEASTTEGIGLSAFWMHRNLLGGGENLRIGAEATHIGLDDGGIDGKITFELERPASFTPDTTARLSVNLERTDDEDERIDLTEVGFGLRHVFSNSLSGRADVKYGITKATDITGTRTYRNLSLPVGLTWDRRDNAFDPKRGFWIEAEAMPFQGFGDTGSGVRATLDMRGYRAVGSRVVFAARLQGGVVAGADILDIPRDYLFWSGGGGTVRGYDFRSLGVPLGRTAVEIGGTQFLGASVEARTRVTEKIGVVAFVDYGHVSDDIFSAAPLDDWHAGAGLGLRYTTPVGPLRLDVATPVAGRDGDGMQFYLGIGQAF